VKTVGDSEQGVMLYGFHKPPPLDVQTTWSQTHNVTVPANFHKVRTFGMFSRSSCALSEEMTPIYLTNYDRNGSIISMNKLKLIFLPL